MNFPLIANIVVFVVLLLLLAQARHKQWSLAKKVLVGLVMGVVFGLLTLFYLKVPESWIVPGDAIQGMVLGYLSHILADMLTPAGVPLLWPCRWRFRFPILAPQKGNQLERVLCMALFAYAVWMPQTLPENSAVRWSSQMINSLQFQFNRFIHHQIEQ